MNYRATFWGTRGSVATPGSTTIRYGGNTPCVQVTHEDHEPGSCVILDAGTGIRLLGRQLISDAGERPITVDILLTHTHWDHIQGLPFFSPLFVSGNLVRVWGARQNEESLETTLRDQMRPVVFPVPLDGVSAQLAIQHIEDGTFQAGGFTVHAARVRHPGVTLSFVLQPESGGARLGYVTDNEITGGAYDVVADWRDTFVEHLQKVDVLIHDATYTPEQLGKREGWGHSSFEGAVDLAVEAKVSQLVLFHHHPDHDDKTIDDMVDMAQAAARAQHSALKVTAAKEGMDLHL